MSNFVVSARKYRPVRFDEVVGQQHVTQTLKNALKSDHLAHAFLFCGPRGVGKTTSARILAKVLNCENRTEDLEPCNSCSSCEAFNRNASLNIIELDAASNNSVDHIRQLNEQVRFQPQQGNYKVFIIDEVHMLSLSAFNAFLKTLEEPPPYAIFILATTEKHKIIPTILSRCQVFDFRRIQIPDIIDHLKEICQQEGIEAEADALHIIAQKGDGALRDALSIFDRIVSFAGGKITYQDVVENLNVLDYDYFFRLTDALLAGDGSEALLIFDEILRHGFEGDHFISGLSQHFRNLLVSQDKATLSLLEAGERLLQRYQQQAGLAQAAFLLSALHLANECDVRYKAAYNKRLHVELTLLRMAHLPQLVKGSALVPDGAGREKKTPGSEPTPPQEDISGKEVTSSGEDPPGPEKSIPTGETADTSPSSPAGEATDQPDPADDPSPEREPAVEKPPQVPGPETRTPEKAKGPTASFTLEGLMKTVKEEEASRVRRTEALQREEVLESWNDFKEKAAPSLQAAMDLAQLSVAEFSITVKLGTQVNLHTIRQENALLDHLKATLHCPELMVSYEIDEALAPKKTPAPTVLSDREKYQRMVQANPAVKELRDRFDLRPDPD